jgi:hypothetical protein
MSPITPGPWTINRIEHRRVFEGGSVPGGSTYEIERNDGKASQRVAKVHLEEDAHAIAALPDLLAAAKDIEALVAAHVYPQPDKPDSKWAKLVRLREAIAKAEGRAS